MAGKSKIGWTGWTWNLWRGCSRKSKGCERCYAERDAWRMAGPGQAYEGLVHMTSKGPAWTGKVRFVLDLLDQPLRWQKSRMIFADSMSDFFHESIPFVEQAAAFAVMAASPRHVFQILTKRPEQGALFFEQLEQAARRAAEVFPDDPIEWRRGHVLRAAALRFGVSPKLLGSVVESWPLPNVWLGVSAEDQGSFDARVPALQRLPAAIRFVSLEPLLGPIIMGEHDLKGLFDMCEWEATDDELEAGEFDPCAGCAGWGYECGAERSPGIDWIIVGGESGPRARPFNVRWAKDIVDRAQDFDVPVFVKQMGSVWAKHAGLEGKGEKMDEWPESVRVRQWPHHYVASRATGE